LADYYHYWVVPFGSTSPDYTACRRIIYTRAPRPCAVNAYGE
jgi:hypothetical protein